MKELHFYMFYVIINDSVKVKVIPQQAEVAQGVPGRLRPRIFLTFGTRPYAPTAFTPGEIPGTYFQGLSRPQGTWFRRGEPWKKSPVTPPGIDPGTFRIVAQCLNHYTTPINDYTYVLWYIAKDILSLTADHPVQQSGHQRFTIYSCKLCRFSASWVQSKSTNQIFLRPILMPCSITGLGLLHLL